MKCIFPKEMFHIFIQISVKNVASANAMRYSTAVQITGKFRLGSNSISGRYIATNVCNAPIIKVSFHVQNISSYRFVRICVRLKQILVLNLNRDGK